MKSVLKISERDNVATALEALEPGHPLDVNGTSLTVRDAIPRGHKIALVAISAGNEVIKYGSPIGLASLDIQPGGHVHTHNVASSRGRGDLEDAIVGPSGSRSVWLPDSPGSLTQSPSPRAADTADAALAEPGDAAAGRSG